MSYPKLPENISLVPDVIGPQEKPSKWRISPPSPTAYILFELVPQTPSTLLFVPEFIELKEVQAGNGQSLSLA